MYVCVYVYEYMSSMARASCVAQLSAGLMIKEFPRRGLWDILELSLIALHDWFKPITYTNINQIYEANQTN